MSTPLSISHRLFVAALGHDETNAAPGASHEPARDNGNGYGNGTRTRNLPSAPHATRQLLARALRDGLRKAGM